MSKQHTSQADLGRHRFGRTTVLCSWCLGVVDFAGTAHDARHCAQADMELALSLPAQRARKLQLLELAPGHSPTAMWQAACQRGGLEAPLLLLPEGFSVLPGDDNVKASPCCPVSGLMI